MEYQEGNKQTTAETYLAGEYSYDQAVQLLKRDTRHFAKRQMTWFRKEPGIHWITLEESDIPGRAATRILKTIDDFLCTFKTSLAIPDRAKTSRTENVAEETSQSRFS